MLRFNAVVMGFLAVLATRFNDFGAKAPKALLSAACVTFVLLALAEYQAFRIFYLHFDRIAGGRTIDDYKNTFHEITCEREKRYRLALWESGIGGIFFTLIFLVMVFQKISACFASLLDSLP